VRLNWYIVQPCDKVNRQVYRTIFLSEYSSDLTGFINSANTFNIQIKRNMKGAIMKKVSIPLVLIMVGDGLSDALDPRLRGTI